MTRGISDQSTEKEVGRLIYRDDMLERRVIVADAGVHPAVRVEFDKSDFSDGPVIDEVGDPYFPGFGVYGTNEAELGFAEGDWYDISAADPFGAYAGGGALAVRIMQTGIYLWEMLVNITSDEVDYSWDFGIDLLSNSFIGLGPTNISINNEQGYYSATEQAAREALGLPEHAVALSSGSHTIFHTRVLNVESAPVNLYPSGWLSPVPGGFLSALAKVKVVYLCPMIPTPS